MLQHVRPRPLLGSLSRHFRGAFRLARTAPLTRELREDSVRSVRSRSRITPDLHRHCGRYGRCVASASARSVRKIPTS